jgi:response regulator RpfG family c-di-GMP phosphodiesterase
MTTPDAVVTSETKSQSAIVKGKPPGGGRVVIVDDAPADAKLLLLLLTEASFDCTVASSGEEALVALQREPFDAVVSDVCMPGISGLSLLTEVRRQHPYVAFLVVTGVDDLRVGIRAMTAGADDYLVKPFEEDAVIASLRRALEKKRLEREVENYRRHLEQMVADRTRELRAALQQLERSYEDTLEALGAAIDLRDSETAGHSRRVCRYSVEIAKRLRLSAGQLKSLAMGAYLHDIGKLGIPDGILLKPGPLSSEEWRLMKQHSQIGYDLVKEIPFLTEAAEIVLTHHERFDGSGYPRALKGEHIPLGARIFAIADTLDAMTSDRPYRRAFPFEDALETIERGSGRLFDPQVVAAFLSVPAETWRTIAVHQRQLKSLPLRLRGPDATITLGLSSIFS